MFPKPVRLIFSLICLFSIAISIGCGYQMVRSFSSWPEGIRKVYVKTFQNQTKEPGLEAIITDALIREFWRWGKVKVINRSEAEAVLSGVITNYSADQPLSFDQDRNIREYELIIHLDIQLQETSTGRIFWRKKNRLVRESFPYFASDLAETRAEEKRAQLKAAEDLAKELLDKSFTGF